MKKLLFILATAFSFNLMAATTLVCNDQNSHSVYKLEINDETTRMTFSPILKDSSTLSKSIVNLRYNEGESNEIYSLYEGVNTDKNTIVIEIKSKEMISGNLTEAYVSFSKDSKMLDQKTLFLCDVTLN